MYVPAFPEAMMYLRSPFLPYDVTWTIRTKAQCRPTQLFAGTKIANGHRHQGDVEQAGTVCIHGMAVAEYIWRERESTSKRGAPQTAQLYRLMRFVRF